MSIRMKTRGDITICAIEGEVDINSSPEIRKSFDKILSKEMPKIVINLVGVTYVDSSGLATLVEILKRMKSYGGKMKLTNVSPKIKSLFEITKLDKLFEIMPDEESAISIFLE